MGKSLKLFGIGSVIAVPVFTIFIIGIIYPSSFYSYELTMILIFPGAIGLLLMALGAHYGLRRFDRYMTRD